MTRQQAEELMYRFELALYNHIGSSGTNLPFAEEDKNKYELIKEKIIESMINKDL